MEPQRYNAHIHAIERQVEMMEDITGILKLEIIRKSNICRRCGKKLKNPESIELGFGHACYKKFMAESNYKPLFEVRKNEQVGEKKAAEAGKDSTKRTDNKHKGK